MNQHRGMLIIAGAHSQQEQRQIRHKFQKKELSRLRKGVYVPTNRFEELKPWQRYELHCISTAITRPTQFLMGKAAAAVWGIPYGAIPNWIELGNHGGSYGDRDSRIKIREHIELPDQPLYQLTSPFSTGRVTSMPQTLLDLARWHGTSDGVQAIDHCLHHRHVSRHQLESLLPALKGRQGNQAATKAVELARVAAESPRESLVRLQMWEAGLPAPHLQATLRDRYGNTIGRADFFYPQFSLAVEYDGEGKYQGFYGISPGEASEAEMQRTKKFGNAGIRLTRITRTTLNDGSWLDDLKEAIDWGRSYGGSFPAQQWDSAGLAWSRAKRRSTSAGWAAP